jgi:hypothetical protein
LRLHRIGPRPTAQLINALLINGSNHHLRARSHGAPYPEAQIGSEQFETMQPRHNERLLRLMGFFEPKEQQHREGQQQSKRRTVQAAETGEPGGHTAPHV